VTSIERFAFYFCHNLTIYAEALFQPAGWDEGWNRLEPFGDARVPVVWGHVSEDDEVVDVMMTGLQGNFPNPFNPDTTISFVVARHALQVHINIYDIRGRLVRTLLDGCREFRSGRHGVEWDGRDENGNSVGSGVYLYRMRTGEYQSVRRMILMK
jgi:hypothetical protein